MGRKRLAKTCTKCLHEKERKDFFRTEWEREELSSSLLVCCLRRCRDCFVKMKQEEEEDLDSLDGDDEAEEEEEEESTHNTERRSKRAKRRRGKMQALFLGLAQDLGLSATADRIAVLERTREVLARLHKPNLTVLASPKITTAFNDDDDFLDNCDWLMEDFDCKHIVNKPMMPLANAVKPLVSLADVVRSAHIPSEFVTHSHCA